MAWQTSSAIQSYPRAIAHIDANAFFASCEKATHPEYNNVPICTGLERGIAASFCYLAKARGVKRGMMLSEVKRLCPDVILLPSDYELYGMFSRRMFDIVRRYSPEVEEYGIDECFVELTGLRRVHHKSYEKIAWSIKQDIQRELNITVSIGLAPTKMLAKLGSNWQKPDGFTCIPGREIHTYLKQWPVRQLWGVGKQTAHHMRGLQIHTAADFVAKPLSYISKHFTKPHIEMWKELQGKAVYLMRTERKNSYKSISKGRTFTPASRDKDFIFSQLSKNLENACIKARRHHHVATKIIVMLKTQDFRRHGIELKLSRASAYPIDIMPLVKQAFEKLYQPGMLYRSTEITLGGLGLEHQIQGNLFEKPLKLTSMKRLFDAVDGMSKQFGKHSIFLASSLKANKQQHAGVRSHKPSRRTDHALKGETERKRLGIPMMVLQGI